MAACTALRVVGDAVSPGAEIPFRIKNLSRRWPRFFEKALPRVAKQRMAFAHRHLHHRGIRSSVDQAIGAVADIVGHREQYLIAGKRIG